MTCILERGEIKSPTTDGLMIIFFKSLCLLIFHTWIIIFQGGENIDESPKDRSSFLISLLAYPIFVIIMNENILI